MYYNINKSQKYLIIALTLLSIFHANIYAKKQENPKNIAPNSFFNQISLENVKKELKNKGAISLARMLDNFVNYYEQNSKKFMINQAREILRMLKGNHYFIKEVYGLGYPFYINENDSGSIALKRRMRNSLSDFLKESKGDISTNDENKMILKLFPDYDTLIVYNADTFGPWSLYLKKDGSIDQSKMLDLMTSDFLRTRKFEMILNAFSEQYLKKKTEEDPYNISDSAYDFAETDVPRLKEQFEFPETYNKKQLMHVDIVPVPLHIWNTLPNFILDEDIKGFYFIRDVLFTCENLLNEKSGIVQNYRINFLLHSLLNKGSVSKSEVFNTIINRHPYKDLISSIPEIYNYTKKLWDEILELSITEGYLKTNNIMNISISNAGTKRIKEALKTRDRIFKKGYDDNLDSANEYNFTPPIINQAA